MNSNMNREQAKHLLDKVMRETKNEEVVDISIILMALFDGTEAQNSCCIHCTGATARALNLPPVHPLPVISRNALVG